MRSRHALYRNAAPWLLAAAAAVPLRAAAMPPVQDPAAPAPAEAVEDVQSHAIESYLVQRGLRARTEAAAAARRQHEALPPELEAVVPLVGAAVEGTVEVPIVAMTFANTPGTPYPVAELQQQLFTGPWPTGTMSDHYREMSGGRFNVTGEVFDWTPLPREDVFYAGPLGCNGLCLNSRLGDALTTALAAIDDTVDFRRFDNDGPDNRPNTADDDGFVDFVAFVHPEPGGECAPRGTSDDIWSHRFSLRSLTGSNFATNDPGRQGVSIMIDDYVIMPAFACDGGTMIPIGVFSHEFGHAFGLPDLYDTRNPPRSAGMGGWDLMASGSWGGDGSTRPMTPSHMSAWSKEFLGWLAPRVIEEDESDIEIRPVIGSGDAVRVDYAGAADPDDTRYLLLEYRKQEGFDSSLSRGGLLVTEINNTRVQAGLVNNSVNARQFEMGVNVVEADGRRQLDRNQSRGDAGDVFPGSANVTTADAGHAETIRAALCNIRQTDEAITLDVFTSRTTCPGALPAQVAISPAEATGPGAIRGTEVVVQGVLTNEGTNYFIDRTLVLKSEDGQASQMIVTAPAALEAVRTPSTAASAGPETLSDLLGKKVLLRGRVQRELQKGAGLTDVLVVEEYEVVE